MAIERLIVALESLWLHVNCITIVIIDNASCKFALCVAYIIRRVLVYGSVGGAASPHVLVHSAVGLQRSTSALVASYV